MEQNYIKAGKIAKQAREYAVTLIKVDASLLEVTEKIENKILDLGGQIAFPTQISLNEIAAHYCAVPKDETIFKKGDVVKVDIGVHINGAIGDTAVTVDLGNNKELVEASKKALENALKIIKPGITLNEIGKVIENTIQSYELEPIRNLSGHGLDLYEIHTLPNIPNYDNGIQKTLQEGQVIAIEPFATNGNGLVTEGKPSTIFKLNDIRPVRNITIRKVLQFIEKEYKTLPFAKRWILKEFPQGNFALNLLQKENIIVEYAQLPERSAGLVSQHEHTVIVKEKPIVTTL